MNKDLLFALYAIHSESGSEKKMRRFLRKQAADCGATSIETDKYGNLLIVKGESDTYPCLAAHMDQVQHIHSKDFRAVDIDGDVIGWSPKCHSQQGLGADDKNGIFICLELLRRFDVMKVAFFVGEEVGCTGSSQVDLGFFKDCRFIIEPDRKGSDDLITSMFCGKVCSEEFIKATNADLFGYKEACGTITDVGELVERGVGISCLNLSCGYYHAHTDEEITVLSDLQRCMDLVEYIVETCTDVYPFEYKGGFGYGRYSGLSYDNYNYGYGYYGGKKYDAAKTAQTEEDEYDEYYNGGYYEADVSLMESYLGVQPDLTFGQIKQFYLEDFQAMYFFGQEEAEFILEDAYDEAKGNLYTHSDFWDEGNDDGSGELSLNFDNITPLRKVS